MTSRHTVILLLLYTALKQPLHARHVTWLTVDCDFSHTTVLNMVCLIPHLSSTEHWELQPQRLFIVFIYPWFMSSPWPVLLIEFQCKSNIKKCLNELCIISNKLFPFPHFPQKRAKKLEGETIYIRHSNLMLEVCIFILEIRVQHLHGCCVDFLFALTPLFVM